MKGKKTDLFFHEHHEKNNHISKSDPINILISPEDTPCSPHDDAVQIEMDSGSSDLSDKKNLPADVAPGLLSERRNILRLGAAGLPMMFTLQASAQSVITSQLRCTMTIPCGYAALIDTSGKVYLANKGWNTAPALTKEVIDDFKSGAEFIFPDGTAPSEYLPEAECGDDQRSSRTSDFNDFQADEAENPIHKIDDVNEDNIEAIYEEGRQFRQDRRDRFRQRDREKRERRDRDRERRDRDRERRDRDRERRDRDQPLDCDYNIVIFPCDDTFQMAEVVSAGGAWSASGLRSFWLDLARSYTQEFNTDKGFPGISCLVSVLNYINTK